ncbi:fibronectin type III domain-containing protein [Paenibacillus sp. Soil750]|uniref:fibronectin type III domain-containing protein n=1 Tax=Paenibacillus sp. Soil750 TaxID=1736398 RepID=UPI0006FF91B1|nr:fibronectin type III domain-containing protein [Paenibacillus sp. Soil750]KRE75541.1 hypothetical protein ASL11_01545 [Paenibacillus sp. Soil750]
MTYNTKKVLVDVDGKQILQYFNEISDQYEPLLGSNGGIKMLLPKAKGSFSGSTSITKTFTSNMDGFVITNDGTSDLSFTINTDTYVVKGGEVFDAFFEPFNSIQISTNSAYRAYCIQLTNVPKSNNDVTAPDNVTNLVASNVTANSLTLSWTASVSKDVAAYQIYNGNALLSSVSGTTYNVAQLAASTSYTFNIKAVDTSNNISDGTQLTVTTSAITPPSSGISSKNITASGATITWPAVAGAASYEVYNGSIWLASTPSVSYMVVGLLKSTSYTLTIKSKNAAGTESTLGNVSFTTIASATTAPSLYLFTDDLLATNMTSTGMLWGDRSGNGYNVGVTKGWPYANSEFVRNIHSDGLDFTSDVVVSNIVSNLTPFSTDVFTWEFEFLASSPTTYYLQSYQIDSQGYAIFFASNSDFHLQTTNSLYTLLPMNSSIFNNKKHHLIVTSDGLNVKVYVDNVLIGSNTTNGRSVIICKYLSIYNKDNGGRFRRVRYYTRVLTDAERTANYNECML